MFSTLTLTVELGVASVALNRPAKMNALNDQAWQELRKVFELVDSMPNARVVVLEANGEHFCSGIDIASLAQISAGRTADASCPARRREELRLWICQVQDAVSAIERCRKPVIAAIHGYCLGAAVDVITACDMRYCGVDASFSVLEIDMAVVPDLGTIQRLPHLVGHGVARELVYTGRRFSGAEAKEMGLVNRSFATRRELRDEVARIAETLARKSPLTLRGCKVAMLHAREHSVASGLQHVATWNAAMLVSNDFEEALAAFKEKRQPVFQD